MAQAQAHSKRSTKFLKDLGIYAIGNLGSKIITFAMVPLYTFFVKDTSDFGYYDLCLTIIFLIMPLATLQLRDGAFRFLLETQDEQHRTRIISFIYRTLLTSLVVSVIATAMLAMFTSIDYLWYCFALLMAMSFFEVIAQVARGLGNNKDFVVAGILSSLSIGVLSIIFVACMNMGIEGIFIANILARVIALLYLEVKMHIVARYFRFNISMKQVGHDILKYSLPLLPGSLCWWLTGSSDRWFINHFLGLDVNGLYAVAFRFNGIILTLATIFYQAWQETAILQYNSPDRDKFFSKMFNSYIGILAILITGYTFTLKVMYPIIVDANYQESSSYLYLLGISAVLFALSAFFDMGYQCAKDTTRTLPAIFLAAIVNIVCNYLLVKHVGVYGAISTSIITYLVLFFYRLHDMKRYFNLSFYRSTAIATAIIPLGAIPYHFLDTWWLLLLYMIVAIVVATFSLPQDTRHEICDKVISKIRRH